MANWRSAANGAQTLLYWRVGERIRREVLGEARADYGEQIVSTLSTQLVQVYLRWLNQNDRAEGEASPIGLILCASADREQVELLDLDSANIRVAQYLHALPDNKDAT